MDYKKIYDDLISKARSENRIKGGDIYYEAHHIIPKCMGGEGKIHQWKTHSNIILLTAKEHFVAHKLLCEIYPDNHKLVYAYFMMCNMVNSTNDKKYIVSSKEYERLRVTFSNFLSVNSKGENNYFYNKKYIGDENGFYKKTHSQDQKLKWSKERKGKNTGLNNPSTKKAKGYTFNKSKNTWRVRIQINNKCIYIGSFKTEDEARNAYLKAKEKYHII
jgi:hypothetical protein